MLHGYERNIHPGHAAHLGGPHSSGINYVLASNTTFICYHCGNPIVRHLKSGYPRFFLNFCASIPRSLGHGQGQPAGIGFPVGRHKRRTQHIAAVHDGKEI